MAFKTRKNGRVPFRSLAFTILIALLIFSLLTTLLFSFISLFSTYQAKVSPIEAVMNEINDNQAKSIAASLWQFDEELCRIQLEGIRRLPNINYAAILEGEKVKLASGTSIGNRLLVREYPLSYLHETGRQANLGVLHLESNLDLLMPELLNNFSQTVLWQALEKSFIAFFIFLLFNQLVARHLKKITEFFEQMDVRRLHVGLDLDRHSPNSMDEFDIVVERVNLMRQNLLDSFQAQKKAEEQLTANQKIIKHQMAELEAKNSELERFTYTVSHDLKSPLITIQGFSGYLLKDMREGRIDRAEKDLEKISNAVQKMQHLLNDLLEMSRVGRIVNKPARFSMELPVREAIELLEGNITNTQAEIVWAGGFEEVLADKLRIREVWQNLIENAIKYRSADKTTVIKLGGERRQDEVVYYVEDNGRGIQPEFLDKIFGLFEKLDPSSEGTGIGLALVRRIIELHGGRIWAESQGAGLGTRFNFTLGEIQT